MISIIKPGHELKLPEHRLDTSYFGGMSEIYGLIDILSQEHEVTLNSLRGDQLVVVNSLCKDRKLLDRIRESSARKFQLVSDLSISFDKDDIGVYTPLTQIPGDIQYIPFEMMLLKYIRPTTDEKTIKFVYAGGSRMGKRDAQFRKYLHPDNPFVDYIITSSKLPMFKHHKTMTKLPFDLLQRTYDKTKYSLVIGDPEYNKAGMLTQRYWEYLLHDVIAFMDREFDPNEILMSASDFRRVSNAAELGTKIEFLEQNKEKYDQMVRVQQANLRRGINYINSRGFEQRVLEVFR